MGAEVVAAPVGSRSDLRLSAQGFISENFDFQFAVATQVLTSQQLEGGLCGIRSGDVVSNVVLGCAIAAAGTVPANIFVALYKTDGTRLAVSADLAASAIWTANANGFVYAPVSYTADYSGGIYAAVLHNGTFGTTQPTFIRAATNLIAGQATKPTNGAWMTVKQAGLTSAPAPATLVLEGGPCFWMAIA